MDPLGARVDLKQLAYFVTVADTGGFSRAARLLRVAQPALSRQVRSLEVELHQNLLLRNGRGVVATEAGKRLLAHARGILQQVERARREVDDVKGAMIGHVAIGLPPTFARVMSAPIVREFRQRFPHASVSIAEALSASIQEWVQVGRVDVGLLYNPVPSPAVDLHPVLDEALCLIAPRGGERPPPSVRLRDLPDYPLIIPGRPHAIRALVETKLAALGLRPRVALEIDAVSAILELVAEGQGYAILSPRALHNAEIARKLATRPIVQPRLTSALAIAVSAQRPATPLQSACVELVANLVPR
jgi:LysR family nitrogen assimilation transcriptional regulator